MFLTLEVVNKESSIFTDKFNRNVQGFALHIEKQILNLDNASSVRKIDVSYFPTGEHYAYRTDITPVENKLLSLITFNFGNVTSEKVVCMAFEELETILTKRNK